ncbi:MAG TPA: PLP-dependent aspartate aminotransferase family protein, partial [Planctomycetaceae bacterium]|nr:PLP-dependent aspartate aminotransferase family protein [Planctomycetaceae bacterium]
MSHDYSEQRFETRCVHVGVDKDDTFNSCITPIYPTSTFRFEALGKTKGYDYTRSGNPTRRALEESLASLEGGIDCRATCTGMSAITATMHLFKPGDHIIAGHDIYGGTYRLFVSPFTDFGIRFSLVNMQDIDNVRKAITPETKCIWIETPSNPLLNLVDIQALADVAKSAGAITITDNTFMSPYCQRPFEMGVDIVVHSTTKYLNGHSDVVGGAIITRDQPHAERIGYIVNALGLGCSPFDAWLVLRGVKTLGPRMEAHQRGAMALARMLHEHPQVEKVYYPGLPDHPHHALAKRQMKGFGGMLSFDVKGGRAAAEKVMLGARLFSMAESLGGVESLIEHPETMSHASMTLEARRGAGITDKTLRVSVGIEHPDDLIADLRQALE